MKENNLYKTLFEFSPSGILITTVEGKIISVNPAAIDILGYLEAELLNLEQIKLVRSSYHSVDPKGMKNVSSAENLPYEAQCCRKDGKKVFIDIRETKIILPDEQDGIMFVFTDITKRKESEEALLQSEVKYKFLVENANDGIIYVQDGLLVYANPKIMDMLGVDPKDFIGKPIDSFLINDEKDKVLDRYRRRLAGEKIPSVYETLVQSLDGKIIPVEFNVNIVHHQDKVTTMVFIRDISDRKNAEEVLKESEEKYKSLTEQIPVGIYRSTEDGRILYANPALANILGYDSVDDLMNVNIKSLYQSPIQRENIIQTIKTQGVAKYNEFKLIRKDGREIWVRDDWSVKFRHTGEVDYFYGVIENINEQKEAMEASTSSEANLRAMLNAIPDLLFKLDSKGVYLDFHSQKGEDLVEESHKLIGKSIYDFFPLDFCNKVIFYINKCLTTNQLQTFEYSLMLAGELNYFEARLVPAGNNEVLSLSRNITEKKKSEEKINILAQTIQNVNECISIGDLNQNFTYVNPAFLKTYQYSEEEIIGKPISIVRHPSVSNEVSNNIFNYTLKGGWKGELLNVRKDGSEFPISLSTAVIRNEKGEAFAFIGVASDITEQKLAEKELLLAKEKAEESDRLKTAFLANMSHEIRSPMNAILGFVRIIKEEEKLSENGSQYIDLIINSGNTLMNVIDDIIDISKIQANQLRLSPHEFDLNSLLSEIYVFFSTQIKNQGKPHTLLHPPLLSNPSPFTINSDDLRIKQVFTNLLSNAIKFTSNGYIKFGYTLIVDDINPRIQFFVADTGIGLTPEKHQMIFERFRQADDSYSRMYGGSGLGLAISKGLVDLMGGEIWVESEADKGSTFYFTLSFESCFPSITNKISSITVSENKQRTNTWSKRTILIVEDMVDVQFFFKKVFERTKAQLLIASTIKEARGFIVNNSNIDLILMDVRLPDGDGYEFAREIKAERPNIPIISQTAYAMQGEREKSRSYGCDDYITKPIDKRLLLDMIGKYFD